MPAMPVAGMAPAMASEGLDPMTATATYRATLSTAWSAANFATQFPAGRHFSGLVGATHDASVSLWREGGPASPGMKNMAELGEKAALLVEIGAAQLAGSVDIALSGGGIGSAETRVALEFKLTRRHPLLTLVAMVAPSPDWFVGVSGQELLKDSRWMTRLEIALEVYDAGTDSGLSFASPDLPSSPREPIQPLTSLPADTDLSAGLHRATRAPLAVLTLERLN